MEPDVLVAESGGHFQFVPQGQDVTPERGDEVVPPALDSRDFALSPLERGCDLVSRRVESLRILDPRGFWGLITGR